MSQDSGSGQISLIQRKENQKKMSDSREEFCVLISAHRDTCMFFKETKDMPHRS